MSTKTSATLYTDASVWIQEKVGGWAMWAASDLGRIIRSGPITEEYCTDTQHAEFAAIVHGLTAMMDEWGSQLHKILVRGDNETVMRLINEPAKYTRLLDRHPPLRKLQEECQRVVGAVTLRALWVKGHQVSDEKQAWVNRHCDEASRREMRLSIDERRVRAGVAAATKGFPPEALGSILRDTGETWVSRLRTGTVKTGYVDLLHDYHQWVPGATPEQGIYAAHHKIRSFSKEWFYFEVDDTGCVRSLPSKEIATDRLGALEGRNITLETAVVKRASTDVEETLVGSIGPLCELTGTEKQVQWAREIRSRLILRNRKTILAHPALQRYICEVVKEARWWIDNRTGDLKAIRKLAAEQLGDKA